MADGWFTGVHLPARLAAAGAGPVRVLPAFGRLDSVAGLALRAALSGAAAAGLDPADATLVLAAHGSGRSARPALAALALRDRIGREAGFGALRLCFIEEAPTLRDALAAGPPAGLVLPLFVARWGHVETDIPAAARSAGFGGTILPPLGAHPEVPALIAQAIREGGAPGAP
jgi:sirohydrochlorin ferrochelatase